MFAQIRKSIVCGMAVAGAGALATAEDVQAYEGLSAFNCHIAQHDWPHTVASNLNGLENRSGNPGSRNMIVSCPVPNDRTDLTSGFVTGFDGNNEVNAVLGEFRVRGCSTNFNGSAFGCSAFQTLRVNPSTVFVGTNDFSLDGGVLSQLNSINDGHRFLEVSIPRPGVSGNSRLIGYEVFP